MILTNPPLEDHKAAVKNKYIELVDKEVDDTEFGKGLKMLSKGLGGLLIEGILDSRVSRSNYILFSLTQFQRVDKQEVVGVGVFGNVFILGEPKFDKNSFSEEIDL